MFIGFGASAQVYQNMAQPGYKFGRARFDSVLTIPTGLGAMRNITGGQDTGQIRFNVSDSSVYVWNGRRWVRPVGGTDTTSLSNRINAKLNISDTAAMLLPYAKVAALAGYQPLNSLSLADVLAVGSDAGGNRITNLIDPTSETEATTKQYVDGEDARKLYITDTASMLSAYARSAAVTSALALKLNISDTAAMLRRYLDTLQAHNTRIISAGGGGSTRWALTGNASAVTDFLGTTNNRTMRFRTNNVERVVIDSTGGLEVLGGREYLSNEQTALRMVTSTTAKELILTMNNSSGRQWNIRSLQSGIFDIRNITNSITPISISATGELTLINTFNAANGKWANVSGDNLITFNTTSATNANASIAGDGSSYTILNTPGASGSIFFRANNANRMTMQGSSGALGMGTTSPNASSLLDMVSTTRGLLIPRMTLTQRNAIASPAAGLQVIVTGETGGEFLSFYNSSTAAWQRVVKLTSAGRLLLGTTTEGSFILDAVGTARVSGQMSINGYTVSSPGTGSIKIGINPNTTGSGVTAVGEGAITTNGYSNSSAFGLGALGLGSGNRVSAFGWYAGYSNNGSFNTYVGAQSGWNQTTGANNVFLGDRAGDKISGGSTNLTIANNSILIGQNTKALADNQTNQIVIGYDETGLGSNTTIIGNSSTVTTAIRGRVLIGTTTVDASAALNITSTTQGVLFPRMTTVQKLAIGTPAAGLQVYDTTLNQMSYYNGTTWVNF